MEDANSRPAKLLKHNHFPTSGAFSDRVETFWPFAKAKRAFRQILSQNGLLFIRAKSFLQRFANSNQINRKIISKIRS